MTTDAKKTTTKTTTTKTATNLIISVPRVTTTSTGRVASSPQNGPRTYTSLQVSLRELQKLESERLAAQAYETQEAERQARENAAAEAKALADAQERAQKNAREEHARFVGIQQAIVERARLELVLANQEHHEARQHQAIAREQQRQHVLEAERVRLLSSKSRIRSLCIGSMFGAMTMALFGCGLHIGTMQPATSEQQMRMIRSFTIDTPSSIKTTSRPDTQSRLELEDNDNSNDNNGGTNTIGIVVAAPKTSVAGSPTSPMIVKPPTPKTGNAAHSFTTGGCLKGDPLCVD